jgi:intein-encoded DNA endonuclease-like protein
MYNKLSATQKAYLAGFLDGDGSVYVRLKPNKDYRFGFQVAPYIIFFQSKQDEKKFMKICDLLDCGYVRERKDGILEYTINRKEEIKELVKKLLPYSLLKRDQLLLIREILIKKETIKCQKDFSEMMEMIDRFRGLNYSKKRKIHKLTP